MNPLISIVIPVYNSLKYLDTCVSSVCNQDYANLEIILVDDGSTDGSGEECDLWSKRDSRIIVIHKKNGGQQDARTAGIMESQGEYIGFVDSDDYIDKDMYSSLIKESENSDMITSGYYEGADRVCFDNVIPGVYQAKDIEFRKKIILFYGKGYTTSGLINSMSVKLFRTSIARKIADRANAGIRLGEDLLFTLLFFFNCETVKITNNVFYHYRRHSESITKSNTRHYLQDQEKLYYLVKDAIFEYTGNDEMEIEWQKIFMNMLLYDIPERLGIRNEAYFSLYCFPDESLIQNKRIIVFGGGKVGRNYISDWTRKELCDVVLWIDNNPDSFEVYGIIKELPAKAVTTKFDYAVIAVAQERTALEMRNQLLLLGIPDMKILWRRPLNMVSKMLGV